MNLSFDDPVGLAVIALGLFFGGILKGATGAGMPVVAVPIIAAVYDARVAVVVLVIPNLVTNVWQAQKYRAHNAAPGFAKRFALFGFLGAALGTALLVRLPVTVLNLTMAAIILGYIGLRLARPGMRLPLDLATRLAPPAGFGGGLLQGLVGLSAPIAVTFGNAVRLDRPVYIFTISLYFTALCVAQLPLLTAFGLFSWQVFALGLAALGPMGLGLPLGDHLGRRMNPKVFDRTILTFLGALALKQLADAIL